MKISLIAAMGENKAIGSGNRLLWHLPDDFKWFKKHTIGKPVIMGKNTMLSLGKPLKDRPNIVITSSDHIPEGFIVARSLEEALKLVPSDTPEVMIIGGGMLYRSALELADTLYLTRVHEGFEADTFFPEWNKEEWEEVFSEHHAIDEKHIHSFEFRILVRKPR